MHAKSTTDTRPRIYDGDGDQLLEADSRSNRLVILPAGDPKVASVCRDRLRIQWGQHLLADVLALRYRSLVCGVNADDNSGGIISSLAELLPTSQWNNESITKHARHFAESSPNDVLVLKYDMDAVKVLALLRPLNQEAFSLPNLQHGFQLVAEMVEKRWDRRPCASVSFLGAKSNALHNEDGNEPSFESVLRTMFDAGFRGDVYPSLSMWECAPTGLFADYPFPDSLKVMRSGGF
ncbi:MAG: hypothetical protein QGH76_03690 [Phycisphaerales bacterium]|jgi:hypothetical protein|nr:hypothetical protein [Phycisphaerales bacterium]